ncbi:hypothetical protein Tco_1097157 [Tanacetum coccineum]
MEFSLEVSLRIKERIKENESKPRKIENITKYPDTKVLENSALHNFLENLEKKMFSTPAMSKRARSTGGHASSAHNERMEEKIGNSSPRRVSLSHSSTPSTPTLSPDHNGLTFSKSTSLFSASLLVNSLPHLSLMPPPVDMTLYTRASSLGWEEWKGKCTFLSLDRELVYTPRGSLERLQHFVGMREKNLIYGGMLVTRIARLLGLLTNEWRSALSVEPQPHVFKKKSLIAIGVIMEFHDGMCVWPRNMAVEEEDDKGDDEGDEGAGGDAG